MATFKLHFSVMQSSAWLFYVSLRTSWDWTLLLLTLSHQQRQYRHSGRLILGSVIGSFGFRRISFPLATPKTAAHRRPGLSSHTAIQSLYCVIHSHEQIKMSYIPFFEVVKCWITTALMVLTYYCSLKCSTGKLVVVSTNFQIAQKQKKSCLWFDGLHSVL